MRLVVVLCVLAGCGRLDFDEVSDASGDGPNVTECEHDEDGDGVGDCADNCPHIIDASQFDEDADGVGNVCDPGQAAQRLLLFRALVADHPFKTLSPGWSQGNDVLDYDDSQGSGVLFLPIDIVNVDVWIGIDIESFNGASKQIGLGLTNDQGAPFLHGDILQLDNGIPRVAVSQFDGNGFTPLAFSTLAGFGIGPVDLRIGIRASGMMMAQASPPGVSTFASSVPGYTGAQGLAVFLDGMVAKLRYIAVIETPQ